MCHTVLTLLAGAICGLNGLILNDIARIPSTEITRSLVYDYIDRGEPFIVTGSTPELARSWTYKSFAEKCGNADAGPGVQNHLVQFLNSLTSQELRMIGGRIQQRFGKTMDQFMEILKRNYTVADLFAHMEEFRGISYVFEHLADYTLPLTLHDWLTEGCPALAASLAQHPIREVMQITRDRVKVRQNRFQGTVNWGWDLTRADMAKLNYHSKMGFSFFAPAGTRSYPLHRHAQKNDNFMYILDGAKKFVIFNMTEGDKLYPTQLSGKTEFAEGDFYYEAEVISADLERHPLLKDAIGAMGVASKGDLIYIPCESIHVVQNEEDVLTVAWHMVVGDKCGAPPIDAQFREGSALKTETSHLKTEL